MGSKVLNWISFIVLEWASTAGVERPKIQTFQLQIVFTPKSKQKIPNCSRNQLQTSVCLSSWCSFFFSNLFYLKISNHTSIRWFGYKKSIKTTGMVSKEINTSRCWVEPAGAQASRRSFVDGVIYSIEHCLQLIRLQYDFCSLLVSLPNFFLSLSIWFTMKHSCLPLILIRKN